MNLSSTLALLLVCTATANIDFSQFNAGDRPKDLGFGVEVTVFRLPGTPRREFFGPRPMVFDTANPTGGDLDLGSPHEDFGGPGRGGGGKSGKPGENRVPQGNLLIISEDGDSSDPDDSRGGGIFVFDFDEPRPIAAVGLLDMDGGFMISAMQADGTMVDFPRRTIGNNAFERVPVSVDNVVQLAVMTFRSGGISFIEFKKDPIGAYGDPHFKTWTGDIYSYPGECDLILVSNPGFDGGAGMNIHLRTKIQSKLSTIESVVVEIDGERLEVASGLVGGSTPTWTNGVADAAVPEMIAGYKIKYRAQMVTNGLLQVYTIDLEDGDAIVIKSFPTLVDVRVRSYENRAAKFGGSLGMAGSLDLGLLVARDGVTVITDPVDLASEWQVQPSDAMLFSSVSGPQAPDSECILPGSTDSVSRRQLQEGSISYTPAEASDFCANAHPELVDECVHDVLSLGDMTIAERYRAA